MPGILLDVAPRRSTSRRALRVAVTAVLGLWLAAFVACTIGDDPAPTSHAHPPDCQAIINACHPKEEGNPGPINDCHEIGHGTEYARCTSEKARCVALCNAAPCPDGGPAAVYPDADVPDDCVQILPDAAVDAGGGG